MTGLTAGPAWSGSYSLGEVIVLNGTTALDTEPDPDNPSLTFEIAADGSRHARMSLATILGSVASFSNLPNTAIVEMWLDGDTLTLKKSGTSAVFEQLGSDPGYLADGLGVIDLTRVGPDVLGSLNVGIPDPAVLGRLVEDNSDVFSPSSANVDRYDGELGWGDALSALGADPQKLGESLIGLLSVSPEMAALLEPREVVDAILAAPTTVSITLDDKGAVERLETQGDLLVPVRTLLDAAADSDPEAVAAARDRLSGASAIVHTITDLRRVDEVSIEAPAGDAIDLTDQMIAFYGSTGG